MYGDTWATALRQSSSAADLGRRPASAAVKDRKSYAGKFVGTKFVRSSTDIADLSEDDKQAILADMEESRKQKAEHLRAKQKLHKAKQKMEHSMNVAKVQATIYEAILKDTQRQEKGSVEMEKWLRQKEEESRLRKAREAAMVQRIKEQDNQKVEARRKAEQERLLENKARRLRAERARPLSAPPCAQIYPATRSRAVRPEGSSQPPRQKKGTAKQPQGAARQSTKPGMDGMLVRPADVDSERQEQQHIQRQQQMPPRFQEVSLDEQEVHVRSPLDQQLGATPRMFPQLDEVLHKTTAPRALPDMEEVQMRAAAAKHALELEGVQNLTPPLEGEDDENLALTSRMPPDLEEVLDRAIAPRTKVGAVRRRSQAPTKGRQQVHGDPVPARPSSANLHSGGARVSRVHEALRESRLLSPGQHERARSKGLVAYPRSVARSINAYTTANERSAAAH